MTEANHSEKEGMNGPVDSASAIHQLNKLDLSATNLSSPSSTLRSRQKSSNPKPKPTEKDLMDLAQKLDMRIPEELKHLYLDALSSIHDAAETTMQEEDYYPRPDRELYPRFNIRFADEDELRRGWAWKADVVKNYSVANARLKEDDSTAVDGSSSNKQQTKGETQNGKTKAPPAVVTKDLDEDVTGPHQTSRLPRSDVDADPSSLHPTANEATAPIEKKSSSGGEDGKAIDNQRKAEGQGEKLLLEGKTVVLKDMIMLADVPCLFGSETGGEYISEMDATCVTRILDSGGHIKGKANCESWAIHWTSSSAPKAIIENPVAKGFSAGGSSSGCAALVGSGEIDMGIGGDQSGSIRVPAAHSGIVGMRPTYGLVPTTGVISIEAEKDIIGPMSRSVYENALLLEAIAGPDWIDLRQADRPMPNPLPKYSSLLLKARERIEKEGLKGVKIGLLKEGFSAIGKDMNIETVVRKAADKFKEMGATVVEVSCPSHFGLSQANTIVTTVGATGAMHGRAIGTKQLKLGGFWEGILPFNQERYSQLDHILKLEIISAEYVSRYFPTAYDRAMNLLRKMSGEVDAVLDEVDVLLMPTCVQPPPRNIKKEAGVEQLIKAGSSSSVNTNPFSATGHPSMSLPVGWSPPAEEDIHQESDRDIRLPVGMLMVGAKYDEMTLLKLGDAWERRFGGYPIVEKGIGSTDA
ncbi:hypothetical protein QFC22_002566 [Naganishia vaughanmartiniae]|uniref:Uncharacterized protein n=1 Tax=Naganishia vaughanmartiniae TaxID=1424756 RepID=A0ACC2X9N9_9TREE|nr:hypothetical protein QFC22_002566 [Naganishia vaughanmartiniae]